jgi:hypothetical protein
MTDPSIKAVARQLFGAHVRKFIVSRTVIKLFSILAHGIGLALSKQCLDSLWWGVETRQPSSNQGLNHSYIVCVGERLQLFKAVGADRP